MYEIDKVKLKLEIAIRGLSIAAAARLIGFMPNYLTKCINREKLSYLAVIRLYEKLQINPNKYVKGWEGGFKE